MMIELNEMVMPGIYTSIAEWIACLIFIYCSPRRLKGWKLALVLLATLLVLIAVNEKRVHTYGLPWFGFMALGLAAMYACICLCAGQSWLEACYTWANAFVLAEFVASLTWEAVYYFSLRMQGSISRNLLIMIALYTICFALAWLFEKRPWREPKTIHARGWDTGSAVIIAIAVFSISNISFAFQDTLYAQSLGVGMLTVRTVVDFAGLMLLYAHKENLREVQLRFELESMNKLFHSQYEQYHRYRENDEIIKKQYHDLKHQIAMIRAERDPKKQEHYLAQLNESLELYETQHKTGNPVVDTMLSGQSMRCREKGIQLISYADATQLDFVSAMDLCSIFGNALDNAIECVENIKDPEKRQITVYVYVKNQFIIIRFENFYNQPLCFKDGLPITTKRNQVLHGYGIRNIRENARKYGGNVNIHAEDGCFQLLVLLPIKQNTH